MDQVITDLNRRYVGTKENILFGVANGGQIMSFTILTSYLTYFYVNIFNIDSKIVATMLFLEGIWDTLNDPLMGTIVDRTRTRFGKLRPYLLGVPVPLAIATVLFFSGPMLIHNPSPTAPSKIIYMVLTYLSWEFLYTVSDVPFWGMAAAISPNPADRTRAITSARFLSNFGSAPSFFMPVLIDLAKGGFINADIKEVFFVAGVTCGILGMALYLLAGIFVKERAVQSLEAPKLKDCYQCITQNPPLKLIILQNLLGALGGIGGVFSTYYFIDVLGMASASIIIDIPSSIVSLTSFAFINKIKKKFNNKQIVIGSKILSDSLNILVFFLCLRRYRNIRFMIPAMMVRNALTAIFDGVNAVVPTEMVADSVDYMEWTTGQRSEGMSFSVLTLVGKLNGAIARSIGSMMISVIGYKTSQTSAVVPQTDAVKFWIYAMNTIIPRLLGLFSIVPIFFYDLVGDKQKRMLEDLAKRREMLSEEAAK
jgi:sugar (glycoside-pentoside-hexuronide) transporter